MKMKSVPMYLVSQRMGMKRDSGRKFALRRGLKFHKRIDPRAGNQPVICITEEEAEALVAYRAAMVLPTGEEKQ